MEPIILASGSPQRSEYLRLLGLPFTCMPSHADEDFETGTEPRLVAEELAVRKVKKTIEKNSLAGSSWVCGADTLIALDGKIYGKPLDRKDAGQMLRVLQGRTHEVWSAIALYNGRTRTIDCRSTASAVSFAALTDAEIEWYLDSGEWEGVAGSYRIQGLAECFITGIQGSFSTIVGLPLHEFYVMLRENGYHFGA